MVNEKETADCAFSTPPNSATDVVSTRNKRLLMNPVISLSAPKDRKLYDNHVMLHPTGEIMARLNSKRIDWYLKKGLAEELPSDNDYRVIRLLFEPKGWGRRGNKSSPRENICVVCGTSEYLTIHHIVPKAFRTLLPENFKSNNCDDCAALCTECHREYELEADEYKKDLIAKYAGQEKVNMYTAKKAWNVLRHGAMDVEKAREVYEKCKEDLEKQGLPFEEMIEMLGNLMCRESQARLRAIVIERIGEVEFIRMWRRHFVEIMSPIYMPEWWNTEDVKIDG